MALVAWLRARGFPVLGPAPAVLLGGYGTDGARAAEDARRLAELLPCDLGRGALVLRDGAAGVWWVQVYGFTDADVPAE